MDPLPPQPPPQPPSTATTTTVAGDGVPTTTTFPPVFPVSTAYATSVISEAQNHIAHAAANPTPGPAHAVAPAPHHPPYAEMIYTAIEALKEKNGSSKRAIAKYIEQAYSDLPPTHSALLTHHLKRLKNNGQLVMVKKSYKLPRSDASSLAAPSAAAGSSSSPTTGFPTGSPRGRGRPPKHKPNLTIQPNSQPGALPVTEQPNNTQPVLVALGLVDEPNPALVKRSPGRPRKAVAVGVGQGAPVFGKRGRGRPPGSKVKKSPGRPRKPKSVSALMGPKRGPGRPAKSEQKAMVIPYANTTANVNVPVATLDPNGVSNAIVAVSPRPRGRPKKGVGPVGVGVGILAGKRRGRPPKVAGVNKPGNRAGRPVGRPRKKAAIPFNEASASLLAVNGDLKRKLEFIQSKVKQAVVVLKPQLSRESPAVAIAAVQELEEIAVMDINAPLREEPPQPPPLLPQPQPQPQPQPMPLPQQQQQPQPQPLFQT